MLQNSKNQITVSTPVRNILNNSLYALVTHQVQQHPAPEREHSSKVLDFSLMRHYG